MKKLLAATMIAFALSTPALAFDLGGIDGIPGDLKETIAQQSGGRITNRQAAQQQAGMDDQQQRGSRQARQSRKGQNQQAMQARMMQSMQSMMDGDSDLGSSIGSFMGR